MRKKGEARYINKKEVLWAIRCQIGRRYEKRNIAILYFGFTTGLRATEMQRLLISNVFDENWEIVEDIHLQAWQTKSKREETAVFVSESRTPQQALIDYINERKAQAAKFGQELSRDEPLFMSQKGGAFKNNQMVQLIIKMLTVDAILPGRATSHSCRVTFGTNLNEKNADPKTIQQAMRIRSVSIMLRYMRSSPDRLKSFCRKSIFD